MKLLNSLLVILLSAIPFSINAQIKQYLGNSSVNMDVYAPIFNIPGVGSMGSLELQNGTNRVVHIEGPGDNTNWNWFYPSSNGIFASQAYVNTQIAAIPVAGAANGFFPGISSLAPGDIIYHNGTTYVRLPIGSTNEVLTVISGLPTWKPSTGGGGGGGSTLTIQSPLTGSSYDGSAPIDIGIQSARADNITKGAATFNPNDFNDDGTGKVSADYVNGQKGTSSVPGYIQSSDWILFNNKQAALTGTGNQLFGMNSAGSAVEAKTASVGTSGTDFNIANTTNSIQFNLPTANASNRGAFPAMSGLTTGDIPIWNGTAWTRFAAGTTGQVPTSNGTGTLPTYQTPSGGGGSITNRTYRYVSPLIDFKTVATTTIFTTDAALGRFVVEDIYIMNTVFTGFSTGITFNLGWTATGYTDYVGPVSITNQPANFSWKLSGNNGAANRVSIPASTAFRINVTTGWGATTATGYVIVVGFYLSN